jgi:hypothetical protein
MDVSDASYYTNTNIMKINVAEWGTPKKKIKKKKILSFKTKKSIFSLENE